MSKTRRFTHFIFSTIIILSLSFSASQPQSASAQGGDGIRRQVNAETGRVSFIGPESGRVLPASRALGSLARPADPALALAKRFAPEFGLKNPERDLSEMKANHPGDGRMSVRYQQNYEGIPIMGAELIVNTNENGDLYSMNGEVSADLSLQTQPTVDSAQAKESALQAAAKWYQKTPEDFIASEPELWIFDESLLNSSTRPVELVWRMEVTSVDNSLPVRELVLVNAQRGSISLHFNQVDTAWHSSGNANTDQTSESPALSSSSSNRVTARDIESNQSINNAAHALLVTTWYVATTGNNSNSCSATGSPCLTINGAIGKTANGDTIKVASGAYTGTGMEVVLIDKNITLTGGWNASFSTQNGTSTIDGEATRRGITVNLDITATIEKFIIQNGYHDCCEEGGGGIYNLGTLTLNNSQVTNNSAHYTGGGIYTRGFLTINNSTISNNRTTGYSTIGGGIANGIYNIGSGFLTLNNSTVSGNSSKQGGGILNGNIATLNNSTISGNSATGGGGGILTQGTLTINNSTIVNNNDPGYGGGIYHYGGSVNMRNTILAKNTSWTGPNCYSHTFSGPPIPVINSSGYNLIGHNSGCSISSTTGDLIGTSANPINPDITSIQNNGGSTITHALMVGSPAINAGNPAAPDSGGSACLSTDQRGIARPVGGRCDIGAYEGSVPWIPSALVSTYTSAASSSLPGTFLCNEADPNCTLGDTYAKDAHKYAIGTYDFYASQHGRDSIDNNGMTIISSVNYCSPSTCPYPYYNAFWSGTQMVFGSGYGFARADDVVAHELTHGVTQYESNLFYYYQSGAINESFSDVWGEYYDQINALGNDVVGVKWQIGEDISGLGAIRSMSNPPAFSDPDKMSSVNYYEGQADSGGVHTNSGLNNKAVFLMVDGGSFNGKTVSSLGWVKATAIYYEANTNLLSSGADYSDLYFALQQACSNLIGQKGIVAGDCLEVKDAIDAVEMNGQPAPNFNTDAPICDAGIPPTYTFTDDLETDTSNWTFTNGAYPRWQYDSPYGSYAQSGLHFLYANDYPDVIADASARLASFVVPPNGYLHFAHAYDFESYLPSPGPYYYDGSVLEYSINGGSTWLDAGSLINYNGYKGTIFTGAGNPLSGRSAFVGSSHGYISTRLNLASLAGQTVTFRWRMGLDEAYSALGWAVDNIKVYNCVSSVISGNAGTAGVTLSYTDGTAKTITSLANGTYALPVSNNWSGTVTPSHACFTFSPASRNYNNVTANQTAQNYTAALKPAANCADIDVSIGGSPQGRFGLPSQGSTRASFAGVNNGPVKIESTNTIPLMGAERVIYKVNGVNTSFSEMMGLPESQLDTTYWLPWYNNVDLDTQLRFGNVSGSTATIHVSIGDVEMAGSPFDLAPGASTRKSFAGINNGPVKVESDVPIVAAERVIYKVNGVNTSFSEMMALPNSQLDNTYWLPWYNNVDLDTQLRFGNVSNSTATIHVYIGGTEMAGSPFDLAPGASTRKSFAGINNGPVKIESDQNIVAAERVIYKVNGINTSFSEMMGLPSSQLNTTYWLPWYNNVDLDTQLRFANLSGAEATVHVYIGGVEMSGSPFTLAAGASTRKSFAGVNNGPVEIVSDVDIVAAERVIYKVNGVNTSFSEMMGLPNSQLDSLYWLPWYNNVDLDTQLRFGAP